MNIFAILSPVGENASLSSAIQEHFPTDSVKVGPGQWLVARRAATAMDVSNLLGISDATSGLGIVLAISSYYGRADNSVWEWMRVKLGTQ